MGFAVSARASPSTALAIPAIFVMMPYVTIAPATKIAASPNFTSHALAQVERRGSNERSGNGYGRLLLPSMHAFPFGGQRLLRTLAIASLILLVHGYHYGVEDEAIYLPAVKQILNPSLYPHDSRFFAAQTGFTAFPALMAFLSRGSHLPVRATFFLVHCFSVVAFVWVLGLLAAKIFPEARSRWAAVLVPCALWTMPVAGTALFIMDQHLHPRNLETIALLAAVLAVLEGRIAIATAALAVALLSRFPKLYQKQGLVRSNCGTQPSHCGDFCGYWSVVLAAALAC
jgi:hypothetical protein